MLIMHTEVRWLSKGKSLTRLVELWKVVTQFLDNLNLRLSSSTAKQKLKAARLTSAISDKTITSQIFYQADIFGHINELNLYLQGRKSYFITDCAKIQSFVTKLGCCC
jgi:hypothetical protein